MTVAVGLLLCGDLVGQQLENGEPVPAGDPTIFFADGSYYVFSSGPGLPIFRSADLVTWRSAGRMFSELPGWANAVVPENKGYVWAPDVVKIGDEYRVYWSTSTLGSRQSVIGFASNRTLDPDSPGYRWVDRSKVIETSPKDDWNAIDPQCFVDRQDNVWLVMGSYWSGIKMRLLDRETGGLSSTDPTQYSLARRTDVNPPAIEGAYLVWHDDFYYLFVSFDRCGWGIHSDYNIRVGRSREVTGPYRDHRGRRLMESGGTLVLQSHGTVRGPGHNSIVQHDGATWLACHYFNPSTGGRRTLQVRPVFWDEQGWPMAGEPVRPAADKRLSLIGRWAYSLDFGEPMTITLNADNTIGGPSVGATWKLNGENLILTWPRSAGEQRVPLAERCFLGPDGSWFVGRNRYGQIVRGSRIGGHDGDSHERALPKSIP